MTVRQFQYEETGRTGGGDDGGGGEDPRHGLQSRGAYCDGRGTGQTGAERQPHSVSGPGRDLRHVSIENSSPAPSCCVCRSTWSLTKAGAEMKCKVVEGEVG